MLNVRSIATYAAVVIAAASLVSAACSGQKKATSAAADANEVQEAVAGNGSAVTSLAFSQGGCFGTCPVYTLKVHADGSATYTGKQYAPYKGLHNGRVPADTVARLLAIAEEVLAKADELPREIDTGIQDHSYSKVLVMTATDTLEFGGTTEFAPPVDRLRSTLMRVAGSVAFEPDPSNTEDKQNRLRITLQAADQIQVVQEEYYRQQMKVVEFEKKDPPTFIVSFDSYTMSAEEMVRSLGRRKEVVKVEEVEVGEQ